MKTTTLLRKGITIKYERPKLEGYRFVGSLEYFKKWINKEFEQKYLCQ